MSAHYWAICVSGCEDNEKKSRSAYRLVDVREELAGRELNNIIESRGLRDDETAIDQLREAWLVVARIKL
jgi:hypothetical protein